MEAKKCKQCGRRKQITDFYKKDSQGHIRKECKPCTIKNVEDYRNRNRDKVNARIKANRDKDREAFRKKTNEYSRLRRERKRVEKESIPLASEEKLLATLEAYRSKTGKSWNQIAKLGGWSPDMLYNIRHGRRKGGIPLEEAENFVKRLYGIPAPLSEYQMQNMTKTVVYLPGGEPYIKIDY